MDKSIQGNSNGIVEQAKQTVANVASDAKEGVTTQLEQAKEAGVEKIETVSEALRGAGEKLEGTGPLPELTQKAAQGIEDLAHFIENKSIGDVFRSIQSFAKKEPALFLGGAVALGIVAGRFLKSSSRRSVDVGDRYETYGFEGADYDTGFGSEGDFDNDDYLSADDLEDDWDTGVRGSSEPMAFETQPQGSSFGGGTVKETPQADEFGNKSGR